MGLIKVILFVACFCFRFVSATTAAAIAATAAAMKSRRGSATLDNDDGVVRV